MPGLHGVAGGDAGWNEFEAGLVEGVPLGRLAEPREIGKVAAFLSALAAGSERSLATASNIGGVAGAPSPCGRDTDRPRAGRQGKAFPSPSLAELV
ncbi:MAG: hypothetical protein JHD35_08250 [Sphingopyxis sp.]|nr:hypothetical protein [Sphingopyxis sp.]